MKDESKTKKRNWKIECESTKEPKKTEHKGTTLCPHVFVFSYNFRKLNENKSMKRHRFAKTIQKRLCVRKQCSNFAQNFARTG